MFYFDICIMIYHRVIYRDMPSDFCFIVFSNCCWDSSLPQRLYDRVVNGVTMIHCSFYCCPDARRRVKYLLQMIYYKCLPDKLIRPKQGLCFKTTSA